MSELTDHIMTRQQAEEEMACLRKIFPIVRLLDRKTLAEQPCYPPWKSAHPCTSCVGREALAGKCQCTKLETMGSKHYQAIARYVEIDGEPSVIEMVLPLDSGALRTLHSDEQLYTDPLIGAYNRRFYEEELKHKYLNAGVAMIDLDDFKLCNDTFGHAAGDAALRLTASSKLQLSASIGGMMAADIPISDAVVVADKRMYLAKRCKNTVVTEDVAPNSVCSGNAHRPTVLIVDDSPMNRDILSEILSDDFEVLEASNGAECLEILDARGPELSILLLDIVMPDMDGFDVLSRMAAQGLLEDLPVVMISSEDSAQTVRRAYELGASDYISRPFDARIVHRRVTNITRLYARQRRLRAMVSQQFYDREKNDQILFGILSQVMEVRYGESSHHIPQVQRITGILLERLCQKTDRYNLTGADRRLIATAAALHDIGRMAIDGRILNAPDPTPEQKAILRTHPILGAQMLENLSQYQDEPLVKFALQICRWHHERWDGSGFPDGLKGDSIPIAAQVVSLADAYDSLVGKGDKHLALPQAQAIAELEAGTYGAFNPLLLECLRDVKDRLAEEAGMDTPAPPPEKRLPFDETSLG